MKKDTTTHIPIEGGSGKIPTGAMKFVNDWPGLFIRGDHAHMLNLELTEILNYIKDNDISLSTVKIKEIQKIITDHVIIESK